MSGDCSLNLTNVKLRGKAGLIKEAARIAEDQEIAATENRQEWLRSRPHCMPRAEDFAIRTAPLPAPADGEFLVRNSYLSVDPAMRGWIADKSTYWPRIEVGDTMRAYSVGEVIESRNPGYSPGEKVM